jgi:hypothetical protein
MEDAPESLTLPEELHEGMQTAWAQSFPQGKSQEQGGILVQGPSQKYQWKPGLPGTSGSFKPNYGDRNPDETLIATGHTHPYDKIEGKFTDISFSSQDLARFIYVDD